MRVDAPPRVTGPPKEIAALAVVMLADNETACVLDCVNAPPPDRLKFAPLSIVSVPVLLIVTGPAFETAADFINSNAAPVKLIPKAALVSTKSWNVVAPVPALCAIDAAVNVDNADTLLALTIVTAPNRVLPTAEEN